MSDELERRSRLLGIKLRALVRDHIGSDPDGEIFPFGLGAALVTSDATFVLVEGDASKALGPSLSWALQHSDAPLHVLADRDTGVLARRAENFHHPISIWHIADRVLLPAVVEPFTVQVEPLSSHLAFIGLIAQAGADVVIEHGVVMGEVQGLEICRVVDDAYTGESRLEVGMGAHDREAFAMIHGSLPTEKALRNVIDAVSAHRSVGADPHPLNTFGAERLMRARVIANPQSVGFVHAEAAEPPVQRMNLKDAVPCVALAVGAQGQRLVVTFAHGIDLDVVPFALDAWQRLEPTALPAVVLRDQDVVKSIERLAHNAITSVQIIAFRAG